jgi:hypothetical protein
VATRSIDPFTNPHEVKAPMAYGNWQGVARTLTAFAVLMLWLHFVID